MDRYIPPGLIAVSVAIARLQGAEKALRDAIYTGRVRLILISDFGTPVSVPPQWAAAPVFVGIMRGQKVHMPSGGVEPYSGFIYVDEASLVSHLKEISGSKGSTIVSSKPFACENKTAWLADKLGDLDRPALRAEEYQALAQELANTNNAAVSQDELQAEGNRLRSLHTRHSRKT